MKKKRKLHPAKKQQIKRRIERRIKQQRRYAK